jgi:membrane associated rhomboid family serine protease
MLHSLIDSRNPRRWPLATAALVGACSAVFAFSALERSALESELAGARNATESFILAHPLLEPSAAQLEDLGQACRTRVRAVARGALVGSGRSAPASQRRLDGLCARLASAWEQHPLQVWGLVPAQPTWYGWFTYAFQHADRSHLLGNLLLLLAAGSWLERRWGGSMFLALYATGAVASGAVFAALQPELGTPLIGASGAVAALLGALFVCGGQSDARLPHACASELQAEVLIPAMRLPLLLWFIHELASALGHGTTLTSGGAGGVAHWAHVGGFTSGVVTALLVQVSASLQRSRIQRPKWLDPDTRTSPCTAQ